jgi:hypothetical protein
MKQVACINIFYIGISSHKKNIVIKDEIKFSLLDKIRSEFDKLAFPTIMQRIKFNILQTVVARREIWFLIDISLSK